MDKELELVNNLPPEKTVRLGAGRPSKASLQSAQRSLEDNQLKFAVWLSMPEQYRRPATQVEFAKEIGVGTTTLWRWRKDPDIIMATRWLALQTAGDVGRISNIIDYFYDTAMDVEVGRRLRTEAARDFLKSVGVYESFRYDNKLLTVKGVEDFDLDSLSEEELWDLYNQRAIDAGLRPAGDESDIEDHSADEWPDAT